MQKKINTLGLISLLLCNIMGVSTFFSSRDILNCVKSCSVALLVWLVGAIVMFMFGLCYAELGSTYPKAGGDVVYLTEAYSKKLGTAYSICSLVVIIPAYCGLFCELIHDQVSDISSSKVLTTVIVLGICVTVALIGNNFLVATSQVLFFMKIVTVLFFFVTSVFTIVFNNKHMKSTLYDSRASLKNISGHEGIMNSMLYSMWGFEGWNCGNYIADEIESPAHTLLVGISTSIVVSWASISIINLAFLLILPYDVYLKEKRFINEYLKGIGISVNEMVIVLVATILPIFGSMLASIMVFKGISKSLFKSYKVNVDFYSLLCMVMATMMYAFFFDTRKVLKLTQICSVFFYTMCSIGLVILRLREPKLARPYKNHIMVPVVASGIGVSVLGMFFYLLFHSKLGNNK